MSDDKQKWGVHEYRCTYKGKVLRVYRDQGGWVWRAISRNLSTDNFNGYQNAAQAKDAAIAWVNTLARADHKR